MAMPTNVFFPSLLIILWDIVSFISVASGCTPGPSLSRDCGRGCYYDGVIGFCLDCTQFKAEEAKQLCPELYETTTINSTVSSTSHATAEPTSSLPQWVIPTVIGIIGLLVLLAISVILIRYRERCCKMWNGEKNCDREQNILHATAGEHENMVKPVQETHQELSHV